MKARDDSNPGAFTALLFCCIMISFHSSSLSTDGKDLGVWIEAEDSLFCLIEIEVKIIQSVHFVDQHQVADAEHQRVFERFVVAFGNTEDHDVPVGAGVEFGRADKVADILENEKVGLFEHSGAFRGELAERAGHHVRVDVAQAAVVDLQGFDACGVRP